MARKAPANDCEIRGSSMSRRAKKPGIQTISPKEPNIQDKAGYNTEARAAPDALGDMQAASQQELQDIQDLMRLKDTAPDQFAEYVQMAADAAKLAEERPDVFDQLMRGDGAAGDEDLTAAQAEKRRAMDAASELTGADKRKGDSKDGVDMDINLPGGAKLGAGGVKEKTNGIVISPRPGFVIKTKLVDTGIKVFVNVCQHERIGESSMVKKLDKEGQEVEGLNIPMSVGPPSVDKDNAGLECIVYDVIINPKTIEECGADKTGGQRDWVCHLAMQSVMSKHDCRLDPKYKLPKLTFKGNKEEGPAKQRIRDDSARPQISELRAGGGKEQAEGTSTAAGGKGGMRSTAGGSAKKRASTIPATALKSTVTAVWSRGGEGLTEERESDFSATSLEDTVRIPPEHWPDLLVVNAAGLRTDALAPDALVKIGVEASAYEVTLKAPGHLPLQVRLPYAALPATASAKTNSHEGTLAVSIHVDKSDPTKRADVGSKPWLLSSALEGGGERKTGRASGGGGATASSSARGVKGSEGGDYALPEDRFHLRLPPGVNQYTGAAEGDDADNNHDLLPEGVDRNQREEEPIGEGESLPEERFHRADIVSQHMIDTREQQRKEKIDRAEKEREARKKQPQDDGVEYVDFDDYRAGGKLGPPAVPPQPPTGAEDVQDAAGEQDPERSRDLAAAARVLSEAVKEKKKGGGNDAPVGSRLSSTFWAELLD
ncbi:unnamed protein product [Ectocarpus sp. 12 AP-2014]